MARTYDFAEAANLVLDQEGAYSSDRNDPGNYTPWGEFKGTKYGISAREYPHLDIVNLTLEQALAIYREDYWDSLRLDEVPWPLNLCIFDGAVNQGAVTVTRLLQEALGIEVDGIFGDQTVAASQSAAQYHASLFLALRAMRYVGTNNFDRYGKGWFSRMFQVVLEA